MNAEILEVLLIDRALGQLSPEVEVLLAEHLATNSGASRTAEALSETVTLAAAVLKPPARKLDLPPPRVAFLPVRRPSRFLPLAASFVVGAGVALLVMRSAGPSREAPVAPVVTASRAPRETDPAVRTLPFWSRERAIAMASTKPSSR